MTTTHPTPEEVMAWLDAEVDPEQASTIGAHVQGCGDCARVAEEFRELTRRLADWDAGPARPIRTPGRPLSPRTYVLWAVAAAAIIVAVISFRGTGLWGSRGTGESRGTGVSAPPSPSGDSAAVTILVFTDWECAPCITLDQAYAPVIARYEARLPGAVRYLSKDYPLDSDCNEYVSRRVHPAACEAAAAVRIADERGRRDEFIQWLAGEGAALTGTAVKSRAETSLGVVDFAVEYARKLPEIRRDVAEGHRLNVQFTPAVIVNGVQANDAAGRAPSATELDLAIQLELRRAGRNCSDTRAC